jgi:hypothetical protein
MSTTPMSMEDMNKGMERSPMGSDNTEKFDAKGNPRSLQEMPDGTTAMMSQEEYNEEIERLHHDDK